MPLLRHIAFLKQVLKYTLMAFGGPNSHLGLMTKIFVEQRKDVSQSELMDMFSFCQILPGPSSTQTITLIGYKRGGLLLAILTLLIWITPACILMALLALGVHHYNITSNTQTLFRFVQPMGIGFLLYAAFQAMRKSVNNPATYTIMLVACIVSMALRSPWVFPSLLLIGGFITNLSDKRLPIAHKQPRKIRWANIYLFFVVFIIAATLSELARVNNWAGARYFNIFENFYRFGSLTWGGGHALAPQISEQFISLPKARGLEPWLSNSDFLTGFGLMNCIPGPVFSFCSYIGGMSMAKWGVSAQLGGSILASIAIFLPSTLLVFFLYPLYNNLKQHIIIYRALEGIYAVVIGLMWASGFLLLHTFIRGKIDVLSIAVIALTFLLLNIKKLPPPIIVVLAILLGWLLK
jgi:chromate transporter